jgi:pilus assembly protein CpaE
MQDVMLRVAVVSADPAFRTAVAELLQSHPEMALVVADLAVPAGGLTAESIEGIQAENPDVVLVDLSRDPSGGMRMVRLMGDSGPMRTLIGTGPALAPELLLEGMKAGITEYLPSPVDAHDLADALRRAARRLGRGGAQVPTTSGQVLTFVGAKGGAGVTTASANAALQIHRQQNDRTLLLDLNFEGGNVAVAMGLKPRYSMVDLLENFHRFDESLLSSLVIKHESGVEVLAAPLLPESVPAITAEQMRAALRLLRRHYGTIVIDLARPYTEYGRAVLDASDVVFLLVVPDMLAVHGARRLLPLIRKGIEARDGRVEVVLNRCDSADDIQRSDVEEALDMRVSHVLRRDDASVASSLNLGKPLTLNGSRSKYAKDMRTLCLTAFGSADASEASAGGTAVTRLLRGLGRKGK